MRTTVFLISTLFFIACGPPKELPQSELTPPPLINKPEQQWLDEGYIKAVVENQSEMEGCGYLLHLPEKDVFLQPINMEDRWRHDDLKVWIKQREIKPIQGPCHAQWVDLGGIERRE